MGKPKNVDTLLYRDVSTFQKPGRIPHRIFPHSKYLGFTQGSGLDQDNMLIQSNQNGESYNMDVYLIYSG